MTEYNCSPFAFTRLKSLAEEMLQEEKYVIHDDAYREGLVERLAVMLIPLEKGDPKTVKDVMWQYLQAVMASGEKLMKSKFFN